MSTQVSLTEKKGIEPLIIVVGIVLACGALVFFGPLFCAGSVYTFSLLRRKKWEPFLWLCIISTFTTSGIVLFWPFVDAQYALLLGGERGVFTLLALWFLWLPVAAYGGYAMRIWEWLAELFRTKTIDEQVEEEAKRIRRHIEAGSRFAAKRALRPAPTTQQCITLGTIIRPGSFPAYTGITQLSGWFQLHEAVTDQHISIVGATGSGKTELIKRIISEALGNTDRDVFLVDGKGDPELAQAFRGLVNHFRHHDAPVYRMGYQPTGAPFDGFRGDAEAIKNRLIELLGIPELQGNALYYGNLHRDVLHLICFAHDGPPRSFTEVKQRLKEQWLRRTYKGDAEALWLIELVTQKTGKDQSPLTQLALQLMAVVFELEGKVRRDGFCLEEARCAVFSIRTQTVSDIAQHFLHYLVEDFKDYIGNRQKRPALLVIDEFATFKSENLHALLSLARSSHLGVILATQDVVTLGDERMQQLILANTRTKILMATDFPEAISKLAGTELHPESSYQHMNGEATELGTTRIQHAFALDPNEVARLPTGDIFVIRQREVAKVHVHQVTGIGEPPPEPTYAATPEEPQKRNGTPAIKLIE